LKRELDEAGNVTKHTALKNGATRGGMGLRLGGLPTLRRINNAVLGSVSAS
jgi:hypothetical protein